MGDQRWEMGKGENGHWTLDGHKHNECELTESDSAFYQLSLTIGLRLGKMGDQRWEMGKGEMDIGLE